MNDQAPISAAIIRFRWPLFAAIASVTVFLAFQAFPVNFDFGFATLFVGAGEQHDRLEDYTRRFGSDVDQVALIITTDDVFTAPVLRELQVLDTELALVPGHDRILSLTTAEHLISDSSTLGTEPLVPAVIPDARDALESIRERVLAEAQVGELLVNRQGDTTALVLKRSSEHTDSACDDGLDNDGDGVADCFDRGCRRGGIQVCGSLGPESTPSACSDSVDNDDDGQIDCDDPGCAQSPHCLHLTNPPDDPETACNNARDDDGDGRIDCLDPDCQRQQRQGCDSVAALTQVVQRSLRRLAAAGVDANIYLAGVPYVQSIYTRTVRHDQMTMLPLSAALVVLMLFVVFRTLRGVLLPIAVVGIGVLWHIGFMMWVGDSVNMINSVIPTLILVIGIADSIHMISRYQDELRQGREGRPSIRTTLRYMLPACLLTSLTSAVGFASLTTASLPIIRNFGLHAAIAIAMTFVLTISVVPLALYQLRPPRRWLPNGDQSETSKTRHEPYRHLTAALDWLVRQLLRHPWRWSLGAALLVFGFCAGIALVHQNSRMMEELREGSPARVSNDLIEERLFGVLSNAVVFEAVERDGLARPEVLEAIDEIAVWVEGYVDPNTGIHAVSHALSIVDLLKQANDAWFGPDQAVVPNSRARVYNLLEQLPTDLRARFISLDYRVAHLTMMSRDIGSRGWNPLREQLEDRVAEALQSRGLEGDISFHITGSSTLAQQTIGHMVGDLMSSLGLAFVVIFVLMAVLFRSLKVGLLSMIPNLLPLLCTLGLLGYLGIPLRMSTVIIFSVSLGIAVDDTIHFLARFREEQQLTPDFALALKRTMLGTGRAIVFTTVLLVTGFASLIPSQFVAVHEMGILGSFTLLVALLADLVILPLVLMAARPRFGQSPSVG